MLKLFLEAIQYVRIIKVISDSDKAIIKASREALLFRNNHLWEKKFGDPDFDVRMGCYDGAEVSELVGIFILNKLSNIIDKIVLVYTVMTVLACSTSYLSNRERRGKGRRQLSKNFKDCGQTCNNSNNKYYIDITFNVKSGI